MLCFKFTLSMTTNFQPKVAVFPWMPSEGSRFTWGSGGEAAFAKSCVCDRKWSQPSATVRSRLQRRSIRFSSSATASGAVLKVCPVDMCRRSNIGVCKGGVCVCDLCRRSDIGVCRGGVCVCVWSVSPQWYWRLQRKCLCVWSVSPQWYWRLHRRCLWVWSMSPQLYWRLHRRSLWEWSASPQLFWRLHLGPLDGGPPQKSQPHQIISAWVTTTPNNCNINM